ncbi:MAG: lipopolysaccharide biosynthesis protein [Pseudomonadota bacterium]
MANQTSSPVTAHDEGETDLSDKRNLGDDERQMPWKSNGLAAQLLRGGSGSLLAKGAEVVLGLLVVMLLARLLGAAGYGVYAFVLALMSLASMPAMAGLPPLVVRETARGQRRGDWSAVRGIWRWANGVALSLSLLIAAGGLLGLWLGWARGEALRETLAWGLGLVPLLALAGVRSASLRGLRHVLAGLFPEQVLRPGLLAVALLVVLTWSGKDISPPDAMGLTVVAALVAFVVGAWLLRRYRPDEITGAVPRYQHGAWMAAAWPMALTQGFQQLNRHADVLLLGLLAATVDVGVYRVAAQGALLVSLGLTALNMVVAPFAARLHVDAERHKLQKLVRRTAQAALAFAVPATLLFVVFGDWLLATLFGDEFRGAYWPLVVLAVGQLVNAWFGPTGMLLNMTGFERAVTRAVAVAAGMNVVLNLLLIPPFGVIGAAIATSASLVFWNVWLWLVARWRLGVSCSAF